MNTRNCRCDVKPIEKADMGQTVKDVLEIARDIVSDMKWQVSIGNEKFLDLYVAQLALCTRLLQGYINFSKLNK